MKTISFAPGPSQLYATVPAHIGAAVDTGILSLSHRSAAYGDMYRQTAANLRELLGIPDAFRIFFLGSATEAMERLIQNSVDRCCFHFVNGSFAARLHAAATALGKEAHRVDAPPGSGFDIEQVSIPSNVEVICFTQNETSTGVQVPTEDIDAVKTAHPDGLVILDIVSSVPYVTLDYGKVDAVFFSVQKGFGLPAGLGVMIVGDAMLRKAELVEARRHYTGGYHSFASLLASQEEWQNPETPNVLGIWLLGKVCADLIDRGIDTIRTETEEKAALLYDFFTNGRGFSPFVSDARFRSQTVVAVDCERPSAPVIARLAEAGLVVAPGYGARQAAQIRVANFPTHTIGDMQRLVNALQT